MQIMRAATPFQRKHFIFQSVRPLAQRRAHRIFRPLQQGRDTILAADPHRQHDRTGRIPQHRPHGSEYRRLSRFHTFDDNRSRCTATRYEILIDYPCIGRKIPSQQSVIKRAGTNACNPFGRNTALGGSTWKQPGGIIVTDITITFVRPPRYRIIGTKQITVGTIFYVITEYLVTIHFEIGSSTQSIDHPEVSLHPYRTRKRIE